MPAWRVTGVRCLSASSALPGNTARHMPIPGGSDGPQALRVTQAISSMQSGGTRLHISNPLRQKPSRGRRAKSRSGTTGKQTGSTAATAGPPSCLESYSCPQPRSRGGWRGIIGKPSCRHVIISFNKITAALSFSNEAQCRAEISVASEQTLRNIGCHRCWISRKVPAGTSKYGKLPSV
jgi:hypothetical protein